MKTSEKNSFYIGFPKSFQEIYFYGNELLAGRAIVINLSMLPEEEKEKCNIFMSGVVLAVKGRMEEITEDVLLVIPPQMELSVEHFLAESFPSYSSN